MYNTDIHESQQNTGLRGFVLYIFFMWTVDNCWLQYK